MVLWDATRHSFLGAVFPMMIGAVMLPITLYVAIRLVTERVPSRLRHDGEQGAQGGFWTYLFWFIGLIGGKLFPRPSTWSRDTAATPLPR